MPSVKKPISFTEDVVENVDLRRGERYFSTQVNSDLSRYYSLMEFVGLELVDGVFTFDEILELSDVCRNLYIVSHGLDGLKKEILGEIRRNTGKDGVLGLKIKRLSPQGVFWLYDRLCIFRNSPGMSDEQARALFRCSDQSFPAPQTSLFRAG